MKYLILASTAISAFLTNLFSLYIKSGHNICQNCSQNVTQITNSTLIIAFFAFFFLAFFNIGKKLISQLLVGKNE